MEVDVNEVGNGATTEGASEIAERVRRRNRAQRPSRRQLEDRGCGQRCPWLAGWKVGRPSDAWRAVDVPELRTRLRDLDVGVPAPSAEQPRRERELAEPRALGEDALTGRTARGPSVVGSGPVCVVSERPVCSGLAGTLEPHGLVLPEREVRRPHQRRDPEATGTPALQRGEMRPDGVVERSLHVAGDDRVPFPRRGAHRARS